MGITLNQLTNTVDKVMSKVKDRYVLKEEGKNLSSIELSYNLNKWMIDNSNIDFIIGGSNGISSIVKNRSNYQLSFGKNTFPHGLFRGILIEQLYRSFKILNNESYHK